ncbi:MAG: hypothetical protein ACTHMW_15955 [Actinomycetes bacterium]
MAGRLLDDNPQLAYEHAQAAVARAGRIAGVREAAGIAAYAAGEYADALRELRTVARMTGRPDTLPVQADCERGLGRPDRALALAGSPEVSRLDQAGQVEMRIVAAGARRDLGQLDAAVVTLQCRELSSNRATAWSARLRYAYADALLAVGRTEEALQWFERAADVDLEGETDADDRVAELQGFVITDLEDEDEDGEEDEDGDADEHELDEDQLDEDQRVSAAEDQADPTGGLQTDGLQTHGVQTESQPETSAPAAAFGDGRAASGDHDGSHTAEAAPPGDPAEATVVRFSDGSASAGVQDESRTDTTDE